MSGGVQDITTLLLTQLETRILLTTTSSITSHIVSSMSHGPTFTRVIKEPGNDGSH
jgi:hypothetical protein